MKALAILKDGEVRVVDLEKDGDELSGPEVLNVIPESSLQQWFPVNSYPVTLVIEFHVTETSESIMITRDFSLPFQPFIGLQLPEVGGFVADNVMYTKLGGFQLICHRVAANYHRAEKLAKDYIEKSGWYRS